MKPLTIKHKIYGRFVITEPVLIDLIKSPALQRLKKVNQHGAWIFQPMYSEKFTRFDHSLGVMLLLKKYGASLEEQIAGLLHDISHTAFSHVGDRVFGRELTQDYQDSKLELAFELQGINKVLKKHGIKPKTILDFSNFTLLEKYLPDLCADRIDYTLQDPVTNRLIKYQAKKLIKNLIVFRDEFVFVDKKSAQNFSYLYLKLNQKVWCNPMQSSLYYILAEAIKIGLDKNIISKKDLFTTDEIVTKKLKAAKDPVINQKLKLLKTLKVKIVPKAKADLYVRSKYRIADPPILQNGKLIRLSRLDKNYRQKIKEFKKWAKAGYYIKIIN
ncbi:MAG: HD domain-containing protein [Candidatus Buchananbacteria bacterium]